MRELKKILMGSSDGLIFEVSSFSILFEKIKSFRRYAVKTFIFNRLYPVTVSLLLFFRIEYLCGVRRCQLFLSKRRGGLFVIPYTKSILIL